MRHKWMPWAVAALLALGLEACETSHSTRIVPPGVALVTKTEATRCWLVIEAGERRGWVVQFEDPQDAEREYFSVRNLHHQELGTLDDLGRAWRFVPHGREAEWIGTGTVLEGARGILDLGSEVELEEVPLSELRAL